MPLADEIRAVRDRALAELRAAYDYHADGARVWAYSNTATGTVTTSATLATRIDGYVTRRLRVSTFVTFLAVFEAFFADVVRAWLRAYPHALADKGDVPVDVVLDALDRDAILDFLIDRAVGGLFYKKPADWFAFLEKRLKVAGPSADELERLTEAKATPDVLIHNRGVVNEVYVRKAGGRARQPGRRTGGRSRRLPPGDVGSADDGHRRPVGGDAHPVPVTCRRPDEPEA